MTEGDVRVSDPHAVMPVACDHIAEIRVQGDVLWLTLASRVGEHEAHVVARLRIPMPVLAEIADALENVLGPQTRN